MYKLRELFETWLKAFIPMLANRKKLHVMNGITIESIFYVLLYAYFGRNILSACTFVDWILVVVVVVVYFVHWLAVTRNNFERVSHPFIISCLRKTILINIMKPSELLQLPRFQLFILVYDKKKRWYEHFLRI